MSEKRPEIDELLEQLPLHDVSDETVESLLHKIDETEIDAVISTTKAQRTRGKLLWALGVPGRYFRWVRDGFKLDFARPKRRMVFAACTTVFVAMFCLRATVSLFFGSDYVDFESGGGYEPRRTQFASVSSKLASEEDAPMPASAPPQGSFSESSYVDSLADRLSGAGVGGRKNQELAQRQLEAPKQAKKRNDVSRDSIYAKILSNSHSQNVEGASEGVLIDPRLSDRKSSVPAISSQKLDALGKSSRYANLRTEGEDNSPVDGMAYFDLDQRPLADKNSALAEKKSPASNTFGFDDQRYRGKGEKSKEKRRQFKPAEKELVRKAESAEAELFESEDELASIEEEIAIEGPIAENFLKARRNLDGLQFKEASGYWLNTYVPGDPLFRQLENSLSLADAQGIHQGNQNAMAHTLSRQTTQPFDAPENSALAVFLHADTPGIQGKTRMLLQVGLKGSTRRSGRRPAMNVAVVLDLRGQQSAETLSRMRALVFAMNKAKDIGDRFSITVAGKPGGLIVEPENFKHGHLSVTFADLLKKQIEVGIASTLSLQEAMEEAIAKVSDSDDPTAPLGSSTVLLLSNNTIGPERSALQTLAHQSAVAGIPVSTVAVGNAASADALKRIALAGQGRLRILSPQDDPKALVDKELNAVSQVVARAVRLRIRLSAGVQLIDVLGSHRLDTIHSERVRQAEQSIDRRLSRNLGITADRGEDEDGIQIVIPSYYADDSHVVLLDVVASGPGPIAEVQIRYKDLVYMRNGVARANLTLGRQENAKGPLEQNVVKNLLSYEVSQSLHLAALDLARGDTITGNRRIQEQLTLLSSFRARVPGFARDADLSRDIEMLTRYTSVPPRYRDSQRQQFIAESMFYAGKRKLLPKPRSD